MRVLEALTGAALLSLLLSGCAIFRPHSQKVQGPPLQTGQGALEQQEQKDRQAPPPSTLPQPSAQAVPPSLPPPKVPKVKHPRKHKPQSPAPAAAEQASNAVPAAAPASPIGQLTSGDSATQAQARRDTLTTISATNDGLAHIHRSLSADEQTTVTKIRTFLKQAKQALDSGDSDGALTLATKAKLLLDELTKQ